MRVPAQTRIARRQESRYAEHVADGVTGLAGACVLIAVSLMLSSPVVVCAQHYEGGGGTIFKANLKRLPVTERYLDEVCMYTYFHNDLNMASEAL